MKNNKHFDYSDLFGIIGSSDKNAKQKMADKMIKNLDKNDAVNLNEIIKDKQKIDAILNSAAAQQIINKINGKNNGQHK